MVILILLVTLLLSGTKPVRALQLPVPPPRGSQGHGLSCGCAASRTRLLAALEPAALVEEEGSELPAGEMPDGVICARGVCVVAEDDAPEV
jgi:hypothetical protein